MLILFSLCSHFVSAENLDETREQKEESPPDQPAVPHTPPSTPVKLEEGELCDKVVCDSPSGGGCMVLCALEMKHGCGSVNTHKEVCICLETSALHGSGIP